MNQLSAKLMGYGGCGVCMKENSLKDEVLCNDNLFQRFANSIIIQDFEFVARVVSTVPGRQELATASNCSSSHKSRKRQFSIPLRFLLVSIFSASPFHSLSILLLLCLSRSLLFGGARLDFCCLGCGAFLRDLCLILGVIVLFFGAAGTVGNTKDRLG